MHYIMIRVRRVIVAGDDRGGFGSVAVCNCQPGLRRQGTSLP